MCDSLRNNRVFGRSMRPNSSLPFAHAYLGRHLSAWPCTGLIAGMLRTTLMSNWWSCCFLRGGISAPAKNLLPHFRSDLPATAVGVFRSLLSHVPPSLLCLCLSHTAVSILFSARPGCWKLLPGPSLFCSDPGALELLEIVIPRVWNLFTV